MVVELQQVVHFERGRFVLRFPTLAAPRYTPALPPPRAAVEAASPEATAGGAFPPIPRPPVAATPDHAFGLHVDLSPGFPLERIESPTHAIEVAGDPARLRWAVDLARAPRAFADGDFVLEWAAAKGREPRAAFFTEEVEGERYALLMVLPPDDEAAPAGRLPRETVFVVDVSGSMQGVAIEQARQALLLALDRLAPGDWFNLIEFHSEPLAPFPDSVPADAASLERARQVVRGLHVKGGTEILRAVQRALEGGAEGRGLVRQVVLVTDGRVTNEAEILRSLRAHLGERRLFTVALGTAPNAAFLRRAAELGRGSFTSVPTLDRVAAAMDELFARLEAPLLREIDVQWSDPAAEVSPRKAPDLYLGEPLVVAARLRSAGAAVVTGERAGRSWRQELAAAREVRGAGLDKLWAAREVQTLLDGLEEEDVDAEAVRREVTALGLRHHLVTPYTSLVAVDVDVTAPAGAAPAPVLVPLDPPRDAAPAAFSASYAASVPPAGGGGIEELITVTAESPLLDDRRLTTATTVAATELERLPAARDPWAVLQATPGVLVDRVDAGGNESGRRAAAVAGGAGAEQGQIQVDGMAVADMTATGGSAAVLGFEAFAELQVTTGGADVSLETPGARLSLLRPRGGDTWRGSARGLWSGGELTAERSAAAGAAGAAGAEDVRANRLETLRSARLEGGGPLALDHLWIWATAGGDAAERVALGGQPQETARDAGGLKLNAQLRPDASAELVWTRAATDGSGAGAGPGRAPETTLDEDGREDVWKGEVTHVARASFYSTAAVAGWERRLREAPDRDGGITIDAAGVAHGSWFAFDEERSGREARLEAQAFAGGHSIDHALTFGAGWRALDEARVVWAPGLLAAGPSVGLPEGSALAELWRGDGRVRQETFSLWSQDLATRGPVTAVAGLRLDRQDVGSPGAETPWTAGPRLGLTWDPGYEDQTLVRVSVARFASRLGSRAAWHAAPGAPGVLFLRLSDAGGGLPLAPWSGDGLGPLRGGFPEHLLAPRALRLGLRVEWN